MNVAFRFLVLPFLVVGLSIGCSSPTSPYVLEPSEPIFDFSNLEGTWEPLVEFTSQSAYLVTVQSVMISSNQEIFVSLLDNGTAKIVKGHIISGSKSKRSFSLPPQEIRNGFSPVRGPLLSFTVQAGEPIRWFSIIHSEGEKSIMELFLAELDEKEEWSERFYLTLANHP